MAKIDKYKVLIPITRDKPKRRDYEVGEVVSGKEFSAEVTANFLEIGVLAPYTEEVTENGEPGQE